MKKQLRSRLPRRRRPDISPIIKFSATSNSFSNHTSYFTALSEVSCESSVASINNNNKLKRVADNAEEEFRRITRSYHRRKLEKEVEVSENSCVESCAGNRDLKLQNDFSVMEEAEAGDEDSEAVSKPPHFSVSDKIPDQDGVEFAEHKVKLQNLDISGEIHDKNLKSEEKVDNSFVSDLVSRDSVAKLSEIGENRAHDVISEVSANCNVFYFCAVDSVPKLVASEVDLACTEQLSVGGSIADVEEEEEISSSSSDAFKSDLEFEFSDDMSSLWSDSGSQFSEKSTEDERASPTFQLFMQFKQQLCRSTLALNLTYNASSDHASDEIYSLGLEDEEAEESYRMLRKRERRQVYLRDYADEYCSTTAYGDLIIQQRLQMVHWIIEQATNKDLQKETMFLGVNLLDRFLSKGYFKTKRNLQIAGIACLTLATRIEENQLFNSIRRKTFNVGNAVIDRSEVVAMEWVVQEVLNFQCFLPTYYNFLWYYLKAGTANQVMEKTTKYLAVLTLLGHHQLCYWPSTVAAGLVILTSLATNQDASFHMVTQSHARVPDDDLPGCIKSLEWLVKYI